MSKLIDEEEGTFYEEDRDQPIPPPQVVAYNEQRSCADLYRMFASGKLEIQPDFQREVVWKREEQARFVDSLVKQLPIPSMCFSLDHRTQKWKVIDGLQRMHTITSFLGSADWIVYALADIDPVLRGKSNNALKNGSEEEKRVYACVEDLTIPITVIRCDYAESSHLKYLFTIFNRLNSGGVRLNNQEIRNCIYSGAFNDLLKEFDHTSRSWASVKRRIWGKMERFRSVEVLLRALAFSDRLDRYDGNLAGFLNAYMHSVMQSVDQAALRRYEDRLTFMAEAAAQVVAGMSPGKKSLTFIEGILVGLIGNKAAIELIPVEGRADWLRERGEQFAVLPIYQGARYALSSAQTVKDRLHASVDLFSR